jgi:bifunctional DNA-binding transcriptional regulator/antitoxin component of YhaV-PrlF toxin-antitoxin module
MTVVVRSKTELIVPRSVRRKAGIRAGDRVEFRVSGGVINIIPELPSADDECTPGQRRVIDARLAEGLADIKAGRTFGPFGSADEMIAHMKMQLNRMRPSDSPRERTPMPSNNKPTPPSETPSEGFSEEQKNRMLDELVRVMKSGALKQTAKSMLVLKNPPQ